MSTRQTSPARSGPWASRTLALLVLAATTAASLTPSCALAKRKRSAKRPTPAEREQAVVQRLTQAIERDVANRTTLALQLARTGVVQVEDAAGQPTQVHLSAQRPLALPTRGAARLAALFLTHGLTAAPPRAGDAPAPSAPPAVAGDAPLDAWVRTLVWAQHALVDGAALGARSEPRSTHRRETQAERDAAAADRRWRAHRALRQVGQALAQPRALEAVVAGWLREAGPGSWPAYRALLSALAHERERARVPVAPLGDAFPLADKQAWRTPSLRRKWLRKLRVEHTQALRARLCAAEDCPPPPPPAAPGAKPLRRRRGLATEVRAALKRWQRRHGLKPHGLVDAATRAALDLPAKDRLATMRLALQRMRDAGLGREALFLVANVPAFELTVWRDGERVRTHRTQVGRGLKRARRGWVPGNRTPLLSMRLRYLVLNPEWVVPTSIRREYRWKIRKDPDFLAKNGFELRRTAGGGERLVMRSGAKNLLGRVKFLFPNAHLVYLHDTPSKRSFSLTKRTRSHGCVRVEHAEELARYLLEQDGHRRFNTRRWAKLMDRSVNRWRPLKRHVGIHLTYWTADTTPKGRARFFPDVYRFDARDRARVRAAAAARLRGVSQPR